MLSVQFQEHIWREIELLIKSANNLGCQHGNDISYRKSLRYCLYNIMWIILDIHIVNSITTALFY